MRVFITGVTGFVGSELAERFRSEGHDVRGSSTRRAGAKASSEVVVHRLGEPIDPAWLAGIDVLVHAAWDLAPTSGSRNVAGSVSWRQAAAASGAHAVFISSYSAYADFPTAYGRDKASAEAAFTGSTASIVRPALVVGRGGLFARLVARVHRSKILPLPDGGRHDVDLIDVSDLCQALGALVTQRRSGSYDLSAGRLPLREVCDGIARALGLRPPLVVPVPMTPFARAFEVLAHRGLAFGVGERLLGYVENGRRLRRSSLAEILMRVPTGPLASVLAQAPLTG